jgi:hypothetical protein
MVAASYSIKTLILKTLLYDSVIEGGSGHLVAISDGQAEMSNTNRYYSVFSMHANCFIFNMQLTFQNKNEKQMARAPGILV